MRVLYRIVMLIYKKLAHPSKSFSKSWKTRKNVQSMTREAQAILLLDMLEYVLGGPIMFTYICISRFFFKTSAWCVVYAWICRFRRVFQVSACITCLLWYHQHPRKFPVLWLVGCWQDMGQNMCSTRGTNKAVVKVLCKVIYGAAVGAIHMKYPRKYICSSVIRTTIIESTRSRFTP